MIAVIFEAETDASHKSDYRGGDRVEQRGVEMTLINRPHTQQLPARLPPRLQWSLKAASVLVVPLLITAVPAKAMEVTVSGSAVILSGPVVGDELAKLRNALSQNPEITLIILRNSHGGHAPTGYQIGELIRQKGMLTAVSGYCISSCSRMFLGGKQRLFTGDYPSAQTFVGFHGHYDAAGALDSQSVARQGLYEWIIKYSDGKADEALVRRWINIQRNTGAANFYHPDLADTRKSSVFFCEGNEPRRPLGCEPLPTNALERGVITDTRRISSPDEATLPHRLRALQNPASGYAAMDDAGKVPLDDEGMNAYHQFLDSVLPRAFAVAASRRHWAWNTGTENAADEAMRRCALRAGQPCKLYAVDDAVVYKP